MNSEPSLGLDVSVLEIVLKDGTSDEKKKLAIELAELTSDPETPDCERNQVVPIVLKLALDEDAEVRKVLAEAMAGTPLAHPDIVFSIAADDDDIALPFIAASPALDSWKMLAIMRVGDPSRQAAVAARPDITAETIADAVNARGPEACAAVLDNPSVSLTSDQYQTLYKRFGRAPEIVERLLAIPDLPLDIRVTQAKRAANRIHQLMAERGWIAANDASAIVADAEEGTIIKILTTAKHEDLLRTVAFLDEKGMLTPSLILRAICLGEMGVVERALAHLANFPVGRVRQMLYAQGPLALRTLHAKTGLPQSCLGLLRAAADVTREIKEEGLRIDAGDYGRRIIEALMTRYESVSFADRSKLLDFVGRFAEDRVRTIAKRLRADLVRAA